MEKIILCMFIVMLFSVQASADSAMEERVTNIEKSVQDISSFAVTSTQDILGICREIKEEIKKGADELDAQNIFISQRIGEIESRQNKMSLVLQGLAERISVAETKLFELERKQNQHDFDIKPISAKTVKQSSSTKLAQELQRDRNVRSETQKFMRAKSVPSRTKMNKSNVGKLKLVGVGLFVSAVVLAFSQI